ncbi:diphosphomevalonate decarboxylase [Amphritea sp. 1_MG-2023]|uniref:diphosphomevalonate decarboxylase n=1 Tax=Amphritea sp. 1_MG-2023 TaxID=3062670 RepID=UPI0026E2AA96|nr:diphosphomevalonate decarboxylase [Amphritea sp. 1_MG-2023]MDO6564131.1 diphosphomevalonate decarboxylase [Amphritea sp. 1_MG-2023]
MSDSLTKQSVISQYLPETVTPLGDTIEAVFAPSNIALCKYWGKRNSELNLPINSSLSISLAHLGTQTRLSVSNEDQVWLNGQRVAVEDSFARKVIAFIDLFRGAQGLPVRVDTDNNIPTAAGLASSASGFAALMLAIDRFYGLKLEPSQLSAFARMGSGSASRSLYHGFVEWQMGVRDDGMDSIALPLVTRWNDLRVGLLKVSSDAKAVDSRSGMNRTVATAHLYQSWPLQAAADLARLHQAIAENNFTQLGETAEQNALSMHATMIASWPPLLYWQPDSVAAMHNIWQARAEGIEVYLTMDAGPNIKLLFMADAEAAIQQRFPDMDVIAPFA